MADYKLHRKTFSRPVFRYRVKMYTYIYVSPVRGFYRDAYRGFTGVHVFPQSLSMFTTELFYDSAVDRIQLEIIIITREKYDDYCYSGRKIKFCGIPFTVSWRAVKMKTIFTYIFIIPLNDSKLKIVYEQNCQRIRKLYVG